MDLTLFLAEKGRALLEENNSPRSSAEALHQVVLSAYHKSESWEHPDAIMGLEAQLQTLSREHLLPETRLLLALLPHRARTIRSQGRDKSMNSVREALQNVEFGDPISHINVTLFPLFAPNGHVPDYVLLRSAIESGTAEVTETSESGSVPELRVVNKGGKPILIPEGEIVTGAKQNRVVNITVLVAAHSDFVLPVSCVEQGRWNRTSREFQATHFAPSRLRAKKCASVRENRMRYGQARSDQGEVWEEVAFSLGKAEFNSRTDSLTECFDSQKDRVAEYFENLGLPPKTTGVLVAHNGQIVGMDLYDCSQTFEALWKRLGEAYFMEAATSEETKGKPIKRDKVVHFLSHFAEGLEPAKQSFGLGTEYVNTDRALSGSALWHEGRILHCCAFPVR
jgi:hypothetical protein